MKYFTVAAFLAAGVLSQEAFEPPNFNIFKALLKNGVDESALQNLHSLSKRSNASRCAAACDSLKQIFGDAKLEISSESAYNTFLAQYWSKQQSEIHPQCIFKPETALDVSTTILVARLAQCPFAARSGGHSSISGGSNIEGGITISFENLNKIAVSSDEKIVSLQPGHTWVEVYRALEKLNLTVIGARYASVGVGGFTLGGGISYFSSVYGLACDNVESYELVTACGNIINVSRSSYPDLYWALRGGGNNFGLVTQFNVAAIAHGPTMWGGRRIYLQPSFSSIIDAYYEMGLKAKEDGKAHQIISFAFQQTQLAQVELEYMDPVGNASILAGWNAISGAIQEHIGIDSQANLTASLAAEAGTSQKRQLFWTWTTQLDKDLATNAKDAFFEEIQTILDAEEVLPTISLQVLTEPILQKTAVNGGNALGLDPNGGPLMLAEVGVSWKNESDDDRMYKVAAAIRDRNVAAAEAKGKTSSYLYMNYGSPWQDPVAGYGAANKARLQAISKKYDPTGVFEKLQPGFFKLDGAPNRGPI